ncbi:MAG: helix-turn-helix domain-containing protein [Gemmatimonadota bacterium]
MSRAFVAAETHAPITVLAISQRERPRALLRGAFPRRRSRLVLVRQSRDLTLTLRGELVDAVIVDLGAANDETFDAIELARDFPSCAFFGLTPLRASDAALVARCASLEFADVVVESVDDAILRDVITPASFTWRFADALSQPPPRLHLESDLARRAWTMLVGLGGRPIQTHDLAAGLAITREHLSRGFAADGGPNLKRVIDLVRLMAAAELAKNPGHEIGDVAAVLGYASSSHLSTTARRVVGTKPSSLSRLRAVDLVERFVRLG